MQEKTNHYCLSCETTQASPEQAFPVLGSGYTTQSGREVAGFCQPCVDKDMIFEYLNGTLKDPVYTNEVITLLKTGEINYTAVSLHLGMKVVEHEEQMAWLSESPMKTANKNLESKCLEPVHAN